MADLAREQGVYIGITLPERDPLTESFYNSAFVLDPQGRMVCRYRKIYAESRWARSGNPYQDGFFDTPWGRVGVAVCADSYFGLIPRTLALKGADLLWVPANWPPSGRLNPLEVWQARALENGFYLAACNRTGKDLVMDCTQTVSAVIDPSGATLVSGSSENSRIFYADLPLDAQGRMDPGFRRARMKSRNVDLYRGIYLTPWIDDLTLYYKLPEPGMLDVHCFVPPSGGMSASALETAVKEGGKDGDNSRPVLWVLPKAALDQIRQEDLLKIARDHNTAFALSWAASPGNPASCLITPRGIQSFFEPEAEFPFTLLHYGPAVIAMVPMEVFRHPELAVVLAKLGCDLVVVSEETLSPEDRLLSRMRVLNGVAVASCAGNAAGITFMEGIHGDLDHRRQDGPGVCSLALDTAKTRKKNFLYRLDYDLLLKKEGI
jgi:predicted amidohydrolase